MFSLSCRYGLRLLNGFHECSHVAVRLIDRSVDIVFMFDPESNVCPFRRKILAYMDQDSRIAEQFVLEVKNIPLTTMFVFTPRSKK